jgi:spore coat protein U-like protein
MKYRSSPARSLLRRLNMAVAVTLLSWVAAPAWSQSLTVMATVVSKSNCKFDINTLALDFSSISSGSTVDATAQTPGRITCNGGQSANVSLAFTIGDGTFPSGAGARRMRHATVPTEYLPYSVSIVPSSAIIPKNSSLDFTVHGRITPAQFQNVLAGSYADLVVITVTP